MTVTGLRAARKKGAVLTRRSRRLLDEELAHAPNPALLDQLPVSPVDISELPDDISRRLFEALRLEISFDHEREQVTFRITLTGDTIDVVRRITEAVVLPFRRTGRYAGDSGQEARQEAEGDVVPFCMVPPTGLHAEPCGHHLRFYRRPSRH